MKTKDVVRVVAATHLRCRAQRWVEPEASSHPHAFDQNGQVRDPVFQRANLWSVITSD